MNNVGVKNVLRGAAAGRWRWLLPAVVFCAVFGLSACDSDGQQNANGAATPAAGTPQGAAAQPAGQPLTAKAVTASKSNITNQPANAIDHNPESSWAAGDHAPQWVQLDLGQPESISKVRLNVNQTPAGPTKHEIYGGPSPDQLTLLGTLEGVTTDKQWIELNASGANVRYVKISTVKSPSWVSWREIEVYK